MNRKRDWRTPALMLILMTVAMQLSFAGWWTLVKNFAVEGIGFTGLEIGIQETVREIPGFLAFLAIYLTLLMREQTLAMVSLLLLGVGVAITGFFPSAIGLYLTTLLMSIGFHYYETMHQSLALQWLPKTTAAATMGKILAFGSMAQLAAYGVIFLTWNTLNLSFETVFFIAGSLTLIVVAFLLALFPQFPQAVAQHKEIVLRSRYWLYYALTFMSGARRQIFTVFAGFLMVEKFGYEVHHVAALFLVNGIVNMVMAPAIGRWISRFGERPALTLEYVGLIGVFVAYAFVETAWIAAALYIIDHAFFSIAIAIKTYFQKIADPADIAPTAGVAFTINHIAAVFIPVLFGFVWLVSPAAVFLSGAAMAAVSLVLARMVPHNPDIGNEVILFRKKRVPAAAE